MTTNHLGEKTQSTYSGWKRAVRRAYPEATFHPHEGTCNAFNGTSEVGYWDDTEGTVYNHPQVGATEASYLQQVEGYEQ